MNAQDLRKLLEQTDDKLSIFASTETLTCNGDGLGIQKKDNLLNK